MGYVGRNRDNASFATLAAVAILASLLSIYWFTPISSGNPVVCDDCAPAPAISVSKAGAGGGSDAGAPAVGEISPVATPVISAKAGAIVDDRCGRLIFSKEAHRRLAPASLTKIAAAIVALEAADVNKLVDVDVDGFYYGDSTVMGLETGMRLTLRDLLYGLLLPSGNDAAVAIARHVAGDVPAFVARMNAKAKSLGLADTHFTNPHGLDAPGHYSSAYDMAILARYAMKNPLFAEIVRTKTWQPQWPGPELWNGNLLLWLYPESDGVKIGWTEGAGQTMVATAASGGRRLFVALLGSQDRYTDAIRLLDWGFQQPEEACNVGGW
ncbi:MAG: serine hydrolase [Dehalococcoidia bacterium]|nr:serine hydrolase [Dehalococcoidia bacterium]